MHASYIPMKTVSGSQDNCRIIGSVDIMPIFGHTANNPKTFLITYLKVYTFPVEVCKLCCRRGFDTHLWRIITRQYTAVFMSTTDHQKKEKKRRKIQLRMISTWSLTSLWRDLGWSCITFRQDCHSRVWLWRLLKMRSIVRMNRGMMLRIKSKLRLKTECK